MKYEKFQIDGCAFVLIEDLLPEELVEKLDKAMKKELAWQHDDNIFKFCHYVKDRSATLQGDMFELADDPELTELSDQLLQHVLDFIKAEFNHEFTIEELKPIFSRERIHRYKPHYYDNAKGNLLYHKDAWMTIFYMPDAYADEGTHFYANEDPEQLVYTLKHKRGMIALFNGDILHAPAKMSETDTNRIVLTMQYHTHIQDIIS
ncbi:UNVERIFIED_ORG: hypothetical protein GCAPEGMB_00277 [Vibrio phage V07]